MLSLVILSVRFANLSEHWWIYIHWDCSIVGVDISISIMTIAISSELPFKMRLSWIEHCLSVSVLLHFISGSVFPCINSVWDCS